MFTLTICSENTGLQYSMVRFVTHTVLYTRLLYTVPYTPPREERSVAGTRVQYVRGADSYDRQTAATPLTTTHLWAST